MVAIVYNLNGTTWVGKKDKYFYTIKQKDNKIIVNGYNEKRNIRNIGLGVIVDNIIIITWFDDFTDNNSKLGNGINNTETYVLKINDNKDKIRQIKKYPFDYGNWNKYV
jgi:hypothetical protein